MRILTNKELGRIFTLRFHSKKKRTHKKNYHIVEKYLDKYGLVASDMFK